MSSSPLELRPVDGAPPEALPVAMQRLRAAALELRALGLDARARAIARVGAAWARTTQPPVSDWLAAAAATGVGYTAPMLEWGCAWTFTQWTRPALLALARDELGDGVDAVTPQVAVVVLAATVPPAGLQSVLLLLLGGCAVVVRAARRLRPLIEAFLAALPPLAAPLAAAVRLTWVEPGEHAAMAKLAAASDAVIVHGSDAAVAAWAEATPPGTPLVGYGHRLSAAALAAGAPLAERAGEPLFEHLALDLCAWDQSGCLSPHVLYVESGCAWSPREVAERLLEAVSRLETRLPAAPPTLAESARREGFVRSRLFDAERLDSPGGATLLVHDTPGDLEVGPGLRVLVVRPCADLDALAGHLGAVSPRLQALALAGASPAATQALRARLAPAGLNYLCAPGWMQRPPLGWRHDGIGSLAPLAPG